MSSFRNLSEVEVPAEQGDICHHGTSSVQGPCACAAGASRLGATPPRGALMADDTSSGGPVRAADTINYGTSSGPWAQSVLTDVRHATHRQRTLKTTDWLTLLPCRHRHCPRKPGEGRVKLSQYRQCPGMNDQVHDIGDTVYFQGLSPRRGVRKQRPACGTGMEAMLKLEQKPANLILTVTAKCLNRVRARPKFPKTILLPWSPT